MNRTTVALLAALEAVIVVAIGLGISLVPLTILWAAQYHLAADWFVFWRASADIWLVGHGVDLTVALNAQLGTALGLPGAVAPFTITIAALGFAALTTGLGVRTGLRASETPYRVTGAVSAVVTVGLLAAVVTFTARSAPVMPSAWQGILLPPLVYAIGIGLGLVFAHLRREPAVGAAAGPAGAAGAPGAGIRDTGATADATDAPRRPVPGGLIRGWLDAIPLVVRDIAAGALRAGTAAAAMVIAGAGIILAILIVVNFGAVIGLYEQLQAGGLGGAALTIGQLSVLPNLVIWLASWMIGPGFAIGTGSSVSPIGTELGPIPGLPLFGVIPPGGFSFGLIGVLVPIVAGFLAAGLLRWRIESANAHRGTATLFLTALAIGIVAGIELGLLAWWSSGSLGPGRLHDVGPNPWLVGAIAAGEVAVAAVIGLLAGGRSRR
ncbi:cell division protein PerM [Leifsonia poae]|uniref:Uncharacterized protein n=1 Tax=Leifsonia poae TaxID=110933 RepID=A0A9W6H7R1_9MICO|nr:DUF6350 family protein [Leifsonia poae]GLJ74979.1 hypothetical protein GCM10017584_05520 [Leifsonia poae]